MATRSDALFSGPLPLSTPALLFRFHPFLLSFRPNGASTEFGTHVPFIQASEQVCRIPFFISFLLRPPSIHLTSSKGKHHTMLSPRRGDAAGVSPPLLTWVQRRDVWHPIASFAISDGIAPLGDVSASQHTRKENASFALYTSPVYIDFEYHIPLIRTLRSARPTAAATCSSATLFHRKA